MAQQQVQRFEIRTRVNHPVGAPQFAAISTIAEIPDPTSTNNNSNNKNNNDIQLTDQTSVITALPHTRGTFNGVVWDRSKPDNSKKAVQSVQCFSTWAAPESYRSALALSSSTKSTTVKSGNKNDDDDEDDDDDDQNDDEGNGDDEDDDDDASSKDGNENNAGDDDDDEKAAQRAIAASRGKNKKKPGGKKGKGRKHIAFRRQPERLPEAWFVLSPIVSNDGATTTQGQQQQQPQQQVLAYDMLPLMEVFSCQRRALVVSQKEEEQQQKAAAAAGGAAGGNKKPGSDVPRLFQFSGTRRKRE